MTKLVDPEPCMELAGLKRNRYFTGGLLTEQDFSDEQSYYLEKGRRHNRYLHGYGVVCGLRVVPGRDGEHRSVVVEPGLALDPWGREIVVAEPAELYLDDHAGTGPHGDARRAAPLFLVVEYAEAATDLVPVIAEPADSDTGGEAKPSRTLETFRLGLRRQPPQTGPDPAQAYCALLAAAREQPVDAVRLHRMLCDVLSQPCSPCDPDPAITLARIELGRDGTLTAAGIDNCSHRRILLSVDQVLQVLLCLLARPGQ